MPMNHAARMILKALSFDGIEVEASRHLADLKRLDPMKIFYKTTDEKIYNGEHEVPVRLFFSDEEMKNAYENKILVNPDVLLFFHGGGWVTESIDTYERICARLAGETGHLVAAVEYRLAPEHKFPAGLEDCYAAAKRLFTDYRELRLDPERITLIGDSARGESGSRGVASGERPGRFFPETTDFDVPGDIQ